ncbi:hypothetical protein LPAF129_17330 [Ligilactobacillus pabuli]|uniref:DUF4352 domain-containing protein n=1 Tax=Ligilactobacillus pabuli TaxID=2886039 RepID=A0ABQ5JJ08_9LACO|nr:hypothetical protein [Ligilactobacillus pabuli]GKS82047.1 hypothetical protein LPAF129_17330 [Ligilactobacillus pabuli]HIW89709.1 hypothetical protein [Candidatus Ligilactobacillus excrementipullorum]
MVKLTKKLLTVLMPVVFLLIGGCSQRNKEESNQASSAEQTVYYQDLSTADQKKVEFTFSADKDEGKSSADSTIYGISADIKNTTNKTVQFNQAKFFYLDDSNKHVSQLDGTVEVKPNASVHIDQVFTGISDQEIDGNGAIVYLNSEHQLAYTKFIGNDLRASSTNLQDQKLVDQFEKARANGFGEKDSDSSSSSSSATKAPSSHHSNGTGHGFGSHTNFVGDYEFYNYDSDRLQSSLRIYSDGTIIQYNNDDTTFSGVATIYQYNANNILSYDVTSDTNDTKSISSNVRIDVKWSSGDTETYYGYTSYDGDQVLTDGVSYHGLVNEVWIK